MTFEWWTGQLTLSTSSMPGRWKWHLFVISTHLPVAKYIIGPLCANACNFVDLALSIWAWQAGLLTAQWFFCVCDCYVNSSDHNEEKWHLVSQLKHYLEEKFEKVLNFRSLKQLSDLPLLHWAIFKTDQILCSKQMHHTQ